jgi:hypothetical protein
MSNASFQSALRLLATLLFAMPFLYSPSYAGEGTAIEAFTSQNAPVLPPLTDTQDKKLASLPPATTIQSLDEPFCFLSTVPVSSGELPERWKTVRGQVESEASVLSSCVTQEEFEPSFFQLPIQMKAGRLVVPYSRYCSYRNFRPLAIDSKRWLSAEN